ncbi:uncharacterized protein LOC128553000 [Mercenaria mercenaria]|uniref:uncharacterized protein LOC128553000 n=1 Tax=Mercenaria mercenaria TaxID=6596 RepID=UPI00234F4104|nr:uncharacterized protein LOC128553000 [Mercenaria mercenaria]
MAVSGRKLTDLPGPVSSSSKDYNCDPCLTIGQHIKAHGFCIDCQEYLCMNCFECHQRTKASKDHQLVKSDTDSGRGSNECTEKCHVHKKEALKFFCKNHEVLGCTDCMTMDHRTCDLDYIPDKCEGIVDSEECRQIMRELDQKVKEIENIIQQATVKSSQVDSCRGNVVEEIIKFRKEINDHLDKIQKNIESDADERKSKDEQIIKSVLEKCTGVSSEMKEVQSRIQDSTSAKQDAQLYITIKRAKSKLSSDEINDARVALEDTNVNYVFERCEYLQNILSNQVFGRLNDSTDATGPSLTVPFDRLTLTDSINVKTKSETDPKFITGCAVLSSHKVIIADFDNKTLNAIDTDSKVIKEMKKIDSEPWDIAVLPQDQIAVTIPGMSVINIMTTASKLSVVRITPVKGRCRSVTYHQDNIYVVCKNPTRILSMDIRGNVHRKILLDNKKFKEPRYIVIDKDSTNIYVSEHSTNSVLCVTQTGEILSIFRHNDLCEPEGITLLDDASLLVCSYDNNAILHISVDFKQCQEFASVEDPQSICCNYGQQMVYVGSHGCDQLRVLNLK